MLIHTIMNMLRRGPIQPGAWHAAGQDVFHVRRDCPAGAAIAPADRIAGTARLPPCPQCGTTPSTPQAR